MSKQLLAIIEQGGYPDFKPLYQELGYEVTVLHSMRKAMAFFKKNKPQVVVAEFNLQSDFRDRISNLEPLLATVEKSSSNSLETIVVVFYEKEYQTQLDKLTAVFNNFCALPFPVVTADLTTILNGSKTVI